MAAGVVLLAVGTWLQVRPVLRYRDTVGESATSKLLFPELSDPSKASSLAITSFDEDMAALRTFKVIKNGGVWVLPAHQNYPADARDQLAAAATELIDKPILGVISTAPGEHETYGVIEPDGEKVKAGETGVGRLIEITDASGNRLARLVIGKEDTRPAGRDAGGRALRFVRRAGQDPVYLIDIDTTKFTTKFDDWIEKDLLKLSPWDVRRLTIDDSTATFDVNPQTGLEVSQDRVAKIELSYDDKEATWSLAKLIEYSKGNKPEERALTDDEQLASANLNDLRNGLGDLKIVDVARKPAGLSAELEADEKFTGDREAVLSLAQRGFFPFQTGEILSSSGETVVGMKDGVEYLLRFGNQTSVETEVDPAADGEEEPAREQGGRYLFVVARLNESLLDKPEPQPLPAVPEAAADAPASAADADADKDADAKTDPAPADEAAKPASEPDKKPAGEAADALAKAEEAEAKAQAAIEERRRVERENRLAREAYEEKLETARKRVRDLNARFADWYYVVSDAEYAKIRLGIASVIEPKPADEPPADEPPGAPPVKPTPPVKPAPPVEPTP
jgi:hypothetical protein